MKIGDKVRFLSETGGGKVAGFQGKDIVLVEDEDGFQIPTAITDVVVIGNEDYSTANVIEAKKQTGKGISAKTQDEDYDPADRPITFKAAPEERKGGEALSAYIAFVPVNPHEMTTTPFESYFINDSNYYMRFVYMTAEGSAWHMKLTDEVEPNTKLLMEEFTRDKLDTMSRVAIQIIAYKRDRTFISKPAINADFRIDPVKFYKLHTFRENDFFEQDALIYTIVENDKTARPLVIDPNELKREMMAKASADRTSAARKDKKMPQDKNAPLVIDLHANELLDTTAGMSSTEILNHQLDVFRNTLKENASNKGKKIIFIHGKGEGILRHAIVNELRHKFKQYQYQDASFQEYGYGATQVTIK
ncbi:DUF2027 domain-containing protein [Xylanibacter muris]|uniref:DUF2027 domain-containing protein n=1 Tax=Xylanibacter muris TaxID=2736290 RepID=A0ABX2AN56_9BACT|nr:DUF2027 domain-containing protein [Xylanibacter muris]NPD92663.1 DUF2027 domain-containing protein [Xylanibacter muris]